MGIEQLIEGYERTVLSSTSTPDEYEHNHFMLVEEIAEYLIERDEPKATLVIPNVNGSIGDYLKSSVNTLERTIDSTIDRFIEERMSGKEFSWIRPYMRKQLLNGLSERLTQEVLCNR